MACWFYFLVCVCLFVCLLGLLVGFCFLVGSGFGGPVLWLVPFLFVNG